MTVQGISSDYPTKISIENNTTYPDPKIKQFDGDKMHIWFAPSVPITTKLELLVTQTMPKAPGIEYEQPEEKGIKQLQFRRGEIIKSQESLYPRFNVSNALTFDQSYFTRTIGQAKIAADLEAKNGPFNKSYQLVSGAGFGAVQAGGVALGIASGVVFDFITGSFRDALKKGWLKKGAQALVEVASGIKFDRLGTAGVEKSLRQFFKRPGTKTDLLIRDCTTEIFVPVMDINGRAMAITKKDFPTLPVYLAVCMSLFDPLWFDVKPQIEGFSILTGDVHKTNDILIAKHNKTSITSIGSPVRIYDHGARKITREALSLRSNDQRHVLELREAEMITNRKRIQCKPLDEVKQFDFSDMAVEKAIQSGWGVL